VEWSPLGSAWVRIKMNQVTSHASVPFFEMPVALLFKNAAQQKTLVVDNKTNGEIFIKNLGFIPDTVLIDPEYWLISKNNTSLKKTETINGTNIVQVYPNPFSSRFYVYLRNFTSATATINLYNSTGQLLLKKTVGLVNGSEYIELPGEQFAAGEYTLSVRTGDGFKFVRKMIKN
jgi:hypothetical protein